MTAALFQKIDSLSVRDPLEWALHYKIESSEQLLIDKFREQLHLVRTILANIGNQIFHYLFGQIHVAIQIAKGHLRLDHPEFAGVPRRVGIFGAKSRAKRVNLRERAGERLGFELTAHGEISLACEKIPRVIDLVILPRRIVRIDSRNAKQFSRPFAIATGDDRRVDVNETALLEKLMDCESQPAADAENAAEKIRARPQMSDLAQKFRRVSFFLERIGFISCADDVDLVRNQLPFLAFTLRGNKRACHNG